MPTTSGRLPPALCVAKRSQYGSKSAYSPVLATLGFFFFHAANMALNFLARSTLPHQATRSDLAGLPCEGPARVAPDAKANVPTNILRRPMGEFLNMPMC